MIIIRYENKSEKDPVAIIILEHKYCHERWVIILISSTNILRHSTLTNNDNKHIAIEQENVKGHYDCD